MSTVPIISALICTRNRSHLLEKCVNSLINQSLDGKKYEIIVVDNDSTDDTQNVLSKYEREHQLHAIIEPEIGLSKARNTGWKYSKTQYIGFIDDDAIASNIWLESALYCFKKATPQPAGLAGPIYLNWEVNSPPWINEDLKTTLGKVYWGDKPFRLTTSHNIIGANCFFSKQQLESCNGFDERFGRKGKLLLSGEEIQLQRRIEAKGGYFYYHSDISIWHHVPVERVKPSWFYRRYYWGGITDFFMNKSLEDFKRNSPLSSKPFSEIENRLNQVKRFSKNTLWSFGFGPSPNEKIWGRIYLSYCFGYLMGAAKYWQRHRQ
ncbi:MAG TPA: glycosyltransferase [Desulfobacterales bacterium]|nr:glycosyltransferase [Desulfobacterales bacterium]